jgi:hypothetical protein
MPLSYDVDVASRLVTLTCGNTTLERWSRLMFDVFADPRYQPDFAILVDCRTATLTPSSDDVRGVVEFIASHRAMLGTSRWAVVVEKAAGFGMARMAETIANIANVDLRAFQSLDEAAAWLASDE